MPSSVARRASSRTLATSSRCNVDVVFALPHAQNRTAKTNIEKEEKKDTGKGRKKGQRHQ
jgi:hypothetical protein